MSKDSLVNTERIKVHMNLPQAEDLHEKIERVQVLSSVEQKPCADKYVELFFKLERHKAELNKPKESKFKMFLNMF